MPLNPSALSPLGDVDQTSEFQPFPSRRSVVHSTKGIVSCTQPLAAQCGLEVLHKGGNCADAAVAVAAGLNMTEPGSTGIGGDMFCLFYNAKTKKVHALNGSGRSGKNCTLETVRKSLGYQDGQWGKIPMESVHAVSVPGAAAGWVDTVKKFGSGKVSLEEILDPAARLGEEGFPVSELMASWWQRSEPLLRRASPNGAEMLKKDPNAKDGCRAPRPGEIMKNPTLANTLRLVGKHGKDGFYAGSVAEELIKVVKDLGGHLELEDLKNHAELGTEEVDAISLKFRGQGIVKSHGKHMQDGSEEGVELWEHPPNGQGIVALMALGIIQELEKAGKIPKFSRKDHNSAAYLHAVVESLRIAFADANWWVADPNVAKVPTQELISPSYLAERAKLFDSSKANPPLDHGSPAHNHSDTVYFACTDSEGNGISFINSNYAGFGTGIIPKGCGFTLQNRAANFVLQPENHPNILAPGKRPYHTIIPALTTNISDQSLHSVYGVMGGFMQPQGHVQVLLNQVVFGMTPQAALDAPRVCIGAGMPGEDGQVSDMVVNLEEGIGEEAVEGMRKLGHQVDVVTGADRGLFGRGQIIRWHVDAVENRGVWSAGSDPRGDGHAVPF
ncbi:related to lincomycin-condensing lmbA [Lecanosticta acicola]|uniref:Related to lincomycin-condensing lmbA n=1 Tax=Lecanosticta acicola TaxID=111012 RepID=A0AAI8W0K5_9PEZI|nr:related to lincomycin-condensing lmbA [Lecanosticta acicola]